jgi:hypothetical protein
VDQESRKCSQHTTDKGQRWDLTIRRFIQVCLSLNLAVQLRIVIGGSRFYLLYSYN